MRCAPSHRLPRSRCSHTDPTSLSQHPQVAGPDDRARQGRPRQGLREGCVPSFSSFSRLARLSNRADSPPPRQQVSRTSPCRARRRSRACRSCASRRARCSRTARSSSGVCVPLPLPLSHSPCARADSRSPSSAALAPGPRLSRLSPSATAFSPSFLLSLPLSSFVFPPRALPCSYRLRTAATRTACHVVLCEAGEAGLVESERGSERLSGGESCSASRSRIVLSTPSLSTASRRRVAVRVSLLSAARAAGRRASRSSEESLARSQLSLFLSLSLNPQQGRRRTSSTMHSGPMTQICT